MKFIYFWNKVCTLTALKLLGLQLPFYSLRQNTNLVVCMLFVCQNYVSLEQKPLALEMLLNYIPITGIVHLLGHRQIIKPEPSSTAGALEAALCKFKTERMRYAFVVENSGMLHANLQLCTCASHKNLFTNKNKNPISAYRYVSFAFPTIRGP